MLWDGKSVNRVRSGEGVQVLQNRRVSAHIMFQPVVADKLVGNATLSAQGLLGRFLIAWPESLAGHRFYRKGNKESNDNLRFYQDRITELLRSFLPLREGIRNEIDPPVIILSRQAKALYEAFYNDLENRISKTGDLYPIKSLAAKMPEHACRLASVLSIYQDHQLLELSRDIMDSGIMVAKYYLEEALRLQKRSNPNKTLGSAEILYDWLVGENKAHVSLVEIYQRGPNSLRSAAKARELVNILIEHGLMAKLENGVHFNGHPRSEAYAVRFSQGN